MRLFGKHEKKKKKVIKRRVCAINKKALNLILEVSKESHPKEFAGLLRAEKGVITEIMLLPGTLSGESSAIFQLHMRPIDFTIVGSVHSHPSYSFHPSGPDLRLFEIFGHTHIITCMPYDYDSWCAYDHYGSKIELEVVD
ncbi:MAG: Mov34/MPN/PAD-1 family protein [Nanoarchaeota archaeon]|nr:Mov34/MPN/PAD-1 family protein [Nanoarchaeota archaeon]